MLLNRKLTLHQRVAYANTCLLSKLWYISHVYPLKENHAQNVNKVLFLYIWGGRYEPVKRSVLYRAKDQGGLAVINCLLKSKTLMLNTFIKCYTHDAYRNSLMFYYCYSRLSNVVPTDYSIFNTTHLTTPYYTTVIHTTRTILQLPGFPFIAKDKIYKYMLPTEKSTTELQYPTF